MSMLQPRLPNRRSRRPLALAVAAGLILVAWLGCHNGSRDAGALTSAGATHLQMREYERAIRDFDRALVLDPGFVAAWRQRALAYRGKGDHERALADLEQAILLAPSDPRFYTDRGVTYELLGDYASAIRDFSRAIAFKPNYAPALEGRGRTYFYLGNFAQAASDLQRGLALDSADAYARALVAPGASETAAGRPRGLDRARRVRRQRSVARAADPLHAREPCPRTLCVHTRRERSSMAGAGLRRVVLPRRGGAPERGLHPAP